MTKPTKPDAVVGPTLDDAANPPLFNTLTFDWVGYTPLAVQYMSDVADFAETKADEVAVDAQSADEDAASALASSNSAAGSAASAAVSEANANAAASLAGAATGLDLSAFNVGDVLAVAAGDQVTALPVRGKRWHVYQRAFSSSGTLIKPLGCEMLKACLTAGGGSGGVNGNTQLVAGGGGEYREAILPAWLFPDLIDVTIGAGGASTTGSAGNDGGDTDFGGKLTAYGGKAGGAITTDLTLGYGESGGGAVPGYNFGASSASTWTGGSPDGGGAGAPRGLNFAVKGGDSVRGGPGGGTGLNNVGGTNRRGAVGGAGATNADATAGSGAGAGGGSVYVTSGGPFNSGAGADGDAEIFSLCLVDANTYQLFTDDAVGVQHSVVVVTSNGSDYSIDWGDGTVATGFSGITASHTYSGPFSGYVTISATAPISDFRVTGTTGGWNFRTYDAAHTADRVTLSTNTGVFYGDLMELPRHAVFLTLTGGMQVTMESDQWPYAAENFERLFLRGDGITEAEVDRVLKAAESVTSFAGVATIDLRGNNAIPSAAGLASKAIVEGNGGTVLVNS